MLLKQGRTKAVADKGSGSVAPPPPTTVLIIWFILSALLATIIYILILWGRWRTKAPAPPPATAGCNATTEPQPFIKTRRALYPPAWVASSLKGGAGATEPEPAFI